MSKLTDQQVDDCAHPAPGDSREWQISIALPSLAGEVQVWRTLIKGGPCETCKGTGIVCSWGDDGHRLEPSCRCDCIDGRKPGIIDRLLAYHDIHLAGDDLTKCPMCAAIADLRKAVESMANPTNPLALPEVEET